MLQHQPAETVAALRAYVNQRLDPTAPREVPAPVLVDTGVPAPTPAVLDGAATPNGPLTAVREDGGQPRPSTLAP